MARHISWALAALLIVGAAQVTPASQTEQQPPDKPQQQEQREGRRGQSRFWWRLDHPIAKDLGLTTEQSASIERIFSDYFKKAGPLREELNQLDKAINRMMEENLVEVSTIEHESGRAEKKRAELNKMRTVALYSFRRVLTAEQRVKFEKHEAERRKQDGDRRR